MSNLFFKIAPKIHKNIVNVVVDRPDLPLPARRRDAVSPKIAGRLHKTVPLSKGDSSLVDWWYERLLAPGTRAMDYKDIPERILLRATNLGTWYSIQQMGLSTTEPQY